MRLVVLVTFLFVSNFVSAQGISFEDHNRAIELSNAAQNMIAQEQYTKAIQLLSLACKTDSTLRDPYLKYFTLGAEEKYRKIAIHQLNKAKSIFVEDDEIIYYLGRLFQMNKKFKLAITEYSEAIEFSKKNGEDFYLVGKYYSNRGACFLFCNMYKPAVDDFEKALTFEFHHGAVYANRGIALYKLGEKSEACNSWIEAQKLGVPSVESYLDKYCEDCNK